MINIVHIRAQWLPDVRLTNDTAESRGAYGHTKWIASNGNKIHVTWEDSRDGTRGIFYRRSTDNGTTWGIEDRISNVTENGSAPSIAATGPMVYILWGDKINENSGLFIARSTNYGITWNMPSLPIVNAGSGSTISCSGSSVYIAWTDLRHGNAEIYFKRSTNYGITWSSDIRLTNAPNVSQFPSLGHHGQNLHVVWDDWRNGQNLDIFYKRSTDGGLSWSSDTSIANTPLTNWGQSLSVSGSNVHMTWMLQNSPSHLDIYYKRSTNNGNSWGDTVNLTSEMISASNGSITSFGSIVHLVFDGNIDGSSEIFYMKSTNSGLSWASPVRLTNNNSSEERPSISVANTNLHVVWQDNRDGNFEIYYKQNPSGNGLFSISGLVTFKDNNQPVTGGYVKALKFDPLTSEIYTVDSTHINSNGTYMLGKVPQDTVDLMFYQDDDLLQFVPTYYVSTIDWRQSTKVYPEQNLTNINCQVYRIENQSSPFTISGHAIGNFNNNLPSGLQDAVIYAKTGSIFKNYGVSIFDGSYIVTKLPAGSYTLIAHRMGFAPLTQDVTITNSSLNSIDFDLGNPLIGIEVLSSNIPVDYFLSQNYPNPFNPSTRIKFGIPTEGFVTVKIFDVLGRLISTPVNENLRAGSYEVNWNSEGLTSGVYFYRIESGGYIKTLKMVLLK